MFGVFLSEFLIKNKIPLRQLGLPPTDKIQQQQKNPFTSLFFLLLACIVAMKWCPTRSQTSCQKKKWWRRMTKETRVARMMMEVKDRCSLPQIADAVLPWSGVVVRCWQTTRQSLAFRFKIRFLHYTTVVIHRTVS